MKKTYRQNKETGEFYEVVKQPTSRRHHIHVSDVDFISPVDGSHIRTRQQLVDHNKRHGVSNDLDSLREQTQRAQNRTHEVGTREERISAIRETIDKLQ